MEQDPAGWVLRDACRVRAVALTRKPHELCVYVGMQKADLCGLLLVFSRIEDLSHCQAVPEPGSSSALCHLPEETEGLREDAHMSREVSGCKY